MRRLKNWFWNAVLVIAFVQAINGLLNLCKEFGRFLVERQKR